MSDVMRVELSPWRKASAVFEDTASGVSTELSNTVRATTDPATCGAAAGLATVDGAIATMLTIFAEMMQNYVVPNLAEGLNSEATAMAHSAKALADMEEENTSQAGSIAEM